LKKTTLAADYIGLGNVYFWTIRELARDGSGVGASGGRQCGRQLDSYDGAKGKFARHGGDTALAAAKIDEDIVPDIVQRRDRTAHDAWLDPT
jgi:hypothetical protein